MIRLFELSPASRTELELRYDGPIPQEMIERAYKKDRADEKRDDLALAVTASAAPAFLNFTDNYNIV